MFVHAVSAVGLEDRWFTYCALQGLQAETVCIIMACPRGNIRRAELITSLLRRLEILHERYTVYNTAFTFDCANSAQQIKRVALTRMFISSNAEDVVCTPTTAGYCTRLCGACKQ